MEAQQPRLKKGGILRRATGTRLDFMFNPPQVRIGHGWNYGKSPVPGRSHPFRGGGAGDDETFNIRVQLDGDRGRDQYRQRIGRITPPISGNRDLNIQQEINQYRALVRPHDRERNGAYGVPDQTILDLGGIFRGIVVVTRIDIDITSMTPLYEPQSANIDLYFEVDAEFNSTDWVVVSSTAEQQLEPAPELLPITRV